MAITVDALVLKSNVFCLNPGLTEVFCCTLVVGLVIGSFRCHNHHGDIFQIDELARWWFLHPANEEVRTIGFCLPLNRDFTWVLDGWVVGKWDIGGAPCARLASADDRGLERRQQWL